MILVDFTRAGHPRTKGSLRMWCQKNARHTVRVEEETVNSSKWRAQMAKAAQVDMMERHGRLVNYAGPVIVTAGFYFERTARVANGERTTEPIASHATVRPTDIHLGDLDKLTRNLLDALVDAHVLQDDSWVVELKIYKAWADGDGAGVRAVVEAL
jgi:Holliday junction resolvase RusA-like endonuclease